MASRTQYELEILLGARKTPGFNGAVSKATSELQGINKTAKRVAGAVTAAFAAVNITGAIEDAMDTYSQYDQSLASSAATFNATATEYEKLDQAAREAGKSTSKTAGESADALGYMALAGWDVKKSTESLMPVLKTSVSSNLDLAETSDLVTDSMSALKLNVSDLPQYLDRVIKGNDSANMTSQQMMQSMILAGGAANTLKIGYTDLGTAIGVLADNGTKGNKSGTALNAMLTRIASNDNAIAQMKKLKISIFDAKGEFIGLEDALKAINKGVSGLSTEDKAQALKQIAGTQYYSKMVYLLGSVKEGAKGSVSAWDELNKKLEHADGALDKKYGKMTDTVSGHTDTMKSAFEDMQISFVDSFSGEYMGILDDFAGVFNDVSESIQTFAKENEIEIHNFVQGTKDGVADAIGVLGDAAEFVVDHFDAIKAGIEGIGAALIAYKVVSGLNGLATSLMSMANPAGLAVLAMGATVGGFVALSSAMRAAEEEAARQNLDRHFGDVALSLEDIDRVAQKIVGKKKLAKISSLLDAIGDTDDKIKDLAEDMSTIQQFKWKADAGIKFNADDTDKMVETIRQYTEDAQEVVEKEGYSVSIAMDILFGENSSQGTESDAFYAGLDAKLKKLSKRLNKRAEKAVKEGFDINTDQTAQKLLKKINKITSTVADAETQAQNQADLQEIQLKYSGKDLNADTFKQLEKEIAEKVEKRNEGAASAYNRTMKFNNEQLALKSITKEEYDANEKEARQAYFNERANAYSDSYEYIMGTIYDAYPELKGKISQLKEKINGELKDVMSSGISGQQLHDKLNMIAKNATDSLDISDDTADGLMDLFSSGLNKIYDGMFQLEEEMNQAGVVVPKGLSKALNEGDALQAMSGETEDMLYFVGDQIGNSPAHTAVVETAKKTGGNYPKGIAEGIRRNSGDVTSAIEDMYNAAKTAAGGTLFAGTIKITTSMSGLGTESMDASGTKPSGAEGDGAFGKPVTPESTKKEKPQKNALGGIYNKEIITSVAEAGHPEAIIPLDGSARGMTLLRRAAAAFGVSLDDGRGATATASGAVQKQNAGRGGGSALPQINYAPQIVIQGNADQGAIANALDISQEKFAGLMHQYMKGKARTSFKD
ncbi:MAG: phage tail tape measure protein [Lachnospiraceae bacterium]|nr:phage tail tape measure protein [Lachnospiraceae bacterium]